MTLALYMDEHVRRAITNALKIRNVDVLTVQEDDRTGVTDEIVINRATELGRVIFTQDDDFLVIANRRQQEALNISSGDHLVQMFQKNMELGAVVVTEIYQE